MKQSKLHTLYEKDMTKKILASLLSILIGLVVGSIIIAAVGFSNPELGASSVWDGIRIVFAGLFSTGRTASGVLTWGFNSTNFGNMLFRATPLIMTGLSVAVAFKTGLFNIGAPGQYLMGTLVSLCIALGIPSSSVAPWLIWILAFLGGGLTLTLYIYTLGLSAHQLLNSAYLSVEVMTAVSSSIGVILSVPITALISAWAYARKAQ